MLEVGAALFLAVPLILLERVLGERIKNVDAKVQNVAQTVSRAQTTIDEISEETRSRITEARAGDAELLEQLNHDPPERTVWDGLHRIAQLSMLDPAGLRVQIPTSELRTRFRPDSAGPVRISVEDRDGTPITGDGSWIPDDAGEVLAELATSFQLAPYAVDIEDHATEIFEELAATLKTLLRLRIDGRPGGPLDRLVELHHPWALTLYGVEHVDDPSRKVRARRLLDDRTGARELLSQGEEDDTGPLDAVLETATLYHSGMARRAVNQIVPHRP
jgi:hypothetical protein